MTDHADPILSLDQQITNVQVITRLWIHYFVESHPGDFKDCLDPGCAKFADAVKP